MLYLACVANGRIISYPQDGTIKLIEEKYLYILTFWKKYYPVQTLVGSNNHIYDQWQSFFAIEMNNKALINGDWKHIKIW